MLYLANKLGRFFSYEYGSYVEFLFQELFIFDISNFY